MPLIVLKRSEELGASPRFEGCHAGLCQGLVSSWSYGTQCGIKRGSALRGTGEGTMGL